MTSTCIFKYHRNSSLSENIYKIRSNNEKVAKFGDLYAQIANTTLSLFEWQLLN